jgi:twinkle protein
VGSLEHHSESSLVRHIPCDNCPSSDANALYDDGHTFCFRCGHHTRGDGEQPLERKERLVDGVRFLDGAPQALAKRGLNEDTCRKFGYLVGRDDNGPVQIANYRDQSGTLVAQKVRKPNKDFYVLGKLPGLYGQHLFRDTGKRMVVTEGEIDALSVSQVFGNKWGAVSVPNGAQGAAKAVRGAVEWLEGFEQVVFMFDMDEPGRAAAAECAAILSPGKAFIAELPLKDANEMLQSGQADALRRAVYEARGFRPGGIHNAKDLWQDVVAAQTPGTPFPWEGVNKITLGLHPKTLTVVTAGTGLGKSTFAGQIAYDMLTKHGKTVGYIALEESSGRTIQRFLSYKLGRLVHLPGAATPQELRGAFDEVVGSGKLWVLDGFGATDSGDLLSRLRYLMVGCQCDLVVLDHISIATSAVEGVSNDERKTIDALMVGLRTLVEQTGVSLIAISHLRRLGEDRGHEDGAAVRLNHLRGSGSIAQIADVVIGLERDQQAEGNKGMMATCRVLKNRITGEVGVACKLKYNRSNGVLTEVSFGDEFQEEELETTEF